MEKIKYHNSVLLKETVDGLNIKPDGVYVDLTFGGGGHSKEILKSLGNKGKLYAFDQDKDALQNQIDDPRFYLINENFEYISNYLRFNGVRNVDGILGDFGVSSHQFDDKSRGFSIRFDSDLDMRMDSENSLDAKKIINEYSQKDLADIFYNYGELKLSRKIATTIVNYRQENYIETTQELKDILKGLFPKIKENKFYAQVFQAIRIEVNNELEVLKSFLEQTKSLLNEGGRLSLISYHSLEDRLVKRFMKNGHFKGTPEKDFYGNVKVPFRLINKKVIVPTQQEITGNNRARSAKLRIAEKI